MKVLRVFYVENKFIGMFPCKKLKEKSEAHFKNIQKQEDFDFYKNPMEAISEIRNRNEYLPLLEDRTEAIEKIKDYPDAFSHKIVDTAKPKEVYSPNGSRMFEQALFSGIEFAKTASRDPRKIKKK